MQHSYKECCKKMEEVWYMEVRYAETKFKTGRIHKYW